MSIGVYLDTAQAASETWTGPTGEEGVLRDCLTANYARLHRRLTRYLGCAERAGDCLHDAWLRLGEMRVPPAVRYPEAYVYRIACNLALDDLRGNRSGQCLADPGGLDGLIDPMPGPEQIAVARSELAAVDRALGDLPQRCQTVLYDLRINDLSRSEVATRLGLSLRRIDTILRQALDYCAGHTRPVAASTLGVP